MGGAVRSPLDERDRGVALVGVAQPHQCKEEEGEGRVVEGERDGGEAGASVRAVSSRESTKHYTKTCTSKGKAQPVMRDLNLVTLHDRDT